MVGKQASVIPIIKYSNLYICKLHVGTSFNEHSDIFTTIYYFLVNTCTRTRKLHFNV